MREFLINRTQLSAIFLVGNFGFIDWSTVISQVETNLKGDCFHVAIFTNSEIVTVKDQSMKHGVEISFGWCNTIRVF